MQAFSNPTAQGERTAPASERGAPTDRHLCPKPSFDLDRLADYEPTDRLAGRNVTKAEIALYRIGNLDLAVKTYANRPAWVRYGLGRWQVRREAAAYRAAAGVPGLPRFFGCPSPLALATEWVPARSLPDLSRLSVDETVFDAVGRTLQALHARGIAIGDLHQRNVLVTEDDRVFIVDFATAWILGERPNRLSRAVFRRLRDFDTLALARMRARWTGGDVQAAVADVGGSVARWHTRGRRLKRAIAFLRGSRPRKAPSPPPATVESGRTEK